jgi:hypothetical protein
MEERGVYRSVEKYSNAAYFKKKEIDIVRDLDRYLAALPRGNSPEVVFIIRKEDKRLVRLKKNGKIEDLLDRRLPRGGQYGRNLASS